VHSGQRAKPLGEPINPELANELRDRLIGMGHAQLASTVKQLRVVEPCGCDKPGCESFYTIPARRVSRSWGKGGETIELAPGLAVDVVGGEIVAVEVVRGDRK
jgi:hypothetical protein